MIRENNPKLKELKEDLFKDSDFEQEENGNNEQKNLSLLLTKIC